MRKHLLQGEGFVRIEEHFFPYCGLLCNGCLHAVHGDGCLSLVPKYRPWGSSQNNTSVYTNSLISVGEKAWEV